MQHFDHSESKYRTEELQNTPSSGDGSGIPWWMIVPAYLVGNFIALAVFPPLSILISLLFVGWLLRKIWRWVATWGMSEEVRESKPESTEGMRDGRSD